MTYFYKNGREITILDILSEQLPIISRCEALMTELKSWGVPNEKIVQFLTNINGYDMSHVYQCIPNIVEIEESVKSNNGDIDEHLAENIQIYLNNLCKFTALSSLYHIWCKMKQNFPESYNPMKYTELLRAGINPLKYMAFQIIEEKKYGRTGTAMPLSYRFYDDHEFYSKTYNKIKEAYSMSDSMIFNHKGELTYETKYLLSDIISVDIDELAEDLSEDIYLIIIGAGESIECVLRVANIFRTFYNAHGMTIITIMDNKDTPMKFSKSDKELFYNLYRVHENVSYYTLSDLENELIRIMETATVPEDATRAFFNNLINLNISKEIALNFNKGVMHFDLESNDEIIDDLFINYNGGDIFSTYRTINSTELQNIILSE